MKAIVLWVLACLVAACTATAIYLVDMRGDCTDNGGTFTVEGGTAWCRGGVR